MSFILLGTGGMMMFWGAVFTEAGEFRGNGWRSTPENDPRGFRLNQRIYFIMGALAIAAGVIAYLLGR